MTECAIQDGVEVLNGKYGRNSYLIPCEKCGRKLRRTQYSRKRTYICDYCKGVIKKKQLAKECESITKYDKRFENAVREIEKQVFDFEDYEKYIQIAKTRAYSYGSIPEAMVAIELLKLKNKIIPQQKIGKYKVDFLIPNKKIVIEVDGIVYHKETTERDAIIQISLGLDWKIIHIPAEKIRKDIKKLKQILNVMQ